MEINKQLFEDVLSGKLKGTFVLRDGCKIKSSKLSILKNSYTYYPVSLNGKWYTYQGEFNLISNDLLDIIDFIPETDMKENVSIIEIPDGKIVDWEESKKQNKIVLKYKRLTYEDVCDKLFKNKDIFYLSVDGEIINVPYSELGEGIYDKNNATTKHQLECILAKNKLANVAKYLNDGWRPNCDCSLNFNWGYFICVCNEELEIHARNSYKSNNNVLFKSKELAQQAIEILREETVKLALETLGI